MVRQAGQAGLAGQADEDFLRLIFGKKRILGGSGKHSRYNLKSRSRTFICCFPF